MLIERAQALTAAASKLNQDEELAREASQFRTRAQQIEQPTTRLAELVRLFALFRQHGLAIDFDQERITTLREHAQTFGTRFEEDPRTILAGDGELRFAFWQNLRDLPNQLNASLLVAWQRFVDDTIREENPELMDTLSRVPGFGTQILALSQRYREAGERRGRLPTADADFARIVELGQQIGQAWLAFEGIPEEVRAFLSAATTQAAGATYDQFTENVVVWLRENDLLRTLGIRFGGRA